MAGSGEDVDLQTLETADKENSEKPEKSKEKASNQDNEKLMKLPLSRVKSIMKSDPDVTLASQEAVIAVAKATELFVWELSKDAVHSTMQSKRKTLQRKDLDSILDTRDCYLFLEGTLD
ncbi:DNA polymerase epsilon subunit 4-like [Ostrea edulis]|uniref:DNA polymerase epsilon subunit 4-like n=1 Tax=Ostrea edulis TaxID=37623 RepID=UPI0020943EA3|nr:DNA polymerase epsilon subunit 4-like [Ostrea edulis]